MKLSAADYYAEKSGKLGPDPLRQDADSERLWDKMRTSKKPVGGILMDQTAVAGIGNIYRAEILFKVDIMIATSCCMPAQALLTKRSHAVCMVSIGLDTATDYAESIAWAASTNCLQAAHLRPKHSL